jgi:glutathione S-transferase
MILLGTNTSPYVRKVRLVLLEKNIPHTYLIDAPNDPGSKVALNNPLGRIPALILDDKTCIYDSTVIAEYVDTLNNTPKLIPSHDNLARMRVKRWEALADGIMDSAIIVRNERMRPASKQEAENILHHSTTISRALSHASMQLEDKEWCEGTDITLADLALFSALVYLDLRLPELNWRVAHHNLEALFQRMSNRQSALTSLAE